MNETGTELATANDSAAVLSVIMKASADPSTDVTKLERLLDMYQRISAKNAETAFNDAMNKAQADMRHVAADSYNPQTRSHYASYAALDKALRPIYIKHGFSLSFDTADGGAETVTVLCYVSHNAGHTRTYRAVMPADGKGAKGGDVMTKTHAAGAGMSYGMRYLLKMIFNVAVGEDDDDGNGASGRPADLPRYSAESFEANFPAWSEAIKSGKRTAAQIVAMISTKGVLTEEQRNRITCLETDV